MTHICVHELDPSGKPGTYKFEEATVPEPKFSHDANFITEATKTNEFGLGKRVWAEKNIYWRLDSDTPDIEGRKQEIELIRLAFLETSLKTNLIIRGRRKQSQDAHIVINWTTEDRFFKDRPNTLAYAWGPREGLGGDITFNDAHIWTVNGKPILGKAAVEAGLVENAHPDHLLKTYDALHTMKHEGGGHAIGMPHLESQNFSDNIMFPYYNGQRNFQSGDLDLLYKLYDKSSFGHRMQVILERYLFYRLNRFGYV